MVTEPLDAATVTGKLAAAAVWLALVLDEGVALGAGLELLELQPATSAAAAASANRMRVFI
jgi:hypothetical protein